MNRFFTLLLAASCLTAVGQVDVTYPYNPDNGDGLIGSSDLLELLTLYGTLFEPEALMVNDIPFQDWVDAVNNTLLLQQALIDSLMGNGVNQTDPCEGLTSVNYHGVEYPVVAIGDQCWFAENLKTLTYQNGDSINNDNSFYSGQSEEWYLVNQHSPVVELGDETYYSVGVVQSGLEVCPSGWSVPTRNDWIGFAAEVDVSLGGHFLKDSVTWNGVDAFGFNARPTGRAVYQENSVTFDWEWECDHYYSNQPWLQEFEQLYQEASDICSAELDLALCQFWIDSLNQELSIIHSSGLAVFNVGLLPFTSIDDFDIYAGGGGFDAVCTNLSEAIEFFYGDPLEFVYSSEGSGSAHWWVRNPVLGDNLNSVITLNGSTAISGLAYPQGNFGAESNLSIRCLKDAE